MLAAPLGIVKKVHGVAFKAATPAEHRDARRDVREITAL